MATTEERMRILKMVADGKISADDASKLLIALDQGRNASARPPKTPPSPGFSASRSGEPRWFRVRVSDVRTGKQKVSVNIPVSLVNLGMKFGARFAPELNGFALTQVMDAVRSGQMGKIVDVHDDRDGERVEVFVE